MSGKLRFPEHNKMYNILCAENLFEKIFMHPENPTQGFLDE